MYLILKVILFVKGFVDGVVVILIYVVDFWSLLWLIILKLDWVFNLL